MAISTTCWHCLHRLKLADHLAGKRVRCPKCQQIIGVPHADDPLPTVATDDELPPGPDLPEENRHSDRHETKTQGRRQKRLQVRQQRSAGFYWAVGITLGILLLVTATLGFGVWLLMRDSAKLAAGMEQAASEPVKQNPTSPSKYAKNEPAPEANKTNPLSYKEVGLLRVFPNKGWGFSIVPPKGWQPVRRKENPFLVFLGPKGVFTENFEVSKLDHDGRSAEKLGADIKQQLPNTLKNWRFGDETHLKVDGRETYAISGRFVLEGGSQALELMRLQYYYIRDDHALYVLSFAVLPATFEKLRGDFEEAAKSVKFE